MVIITELLKRLMGFFFFFFVVFYYAEKYPVKIIFEKKQLSEQPNSSECNDTENNQ